MSHWWITKCIQQSGSKQTFFLCSVYDRQQFDQAVWHFLLLLLSFGLMDCINIHFHPESVPSTNQNQVLIFRTWCAQHLLDPCSLFWSFKIQARHWPDLRKKKRRLHLHRPLAENTVNHYWQTSEVQRGTALISGSRNNFLWKNCISARGEQLPDADTK